MKSSQGRTSIFITGAASGMGRAIAVLFAQRGWFVGAYDLDEAGLHTLQAKIGAENGVFARLDVTNPAGFGAAMDGFGEATGGTLDLMFSNAGIATSRMFDELGSVSVMRMAGINFTSLMTGIRAAVPLLRATPGSLCLVNAFSSAIFGTADIGVYSTTKHAVRGLVEALSVEFKRSKVRAADLLLCLVNTPILSEPMQALAPSDCMWRLVPAGEVAAVVWSAYHRNVLHWYVPAEFRDVVADPERVLEQRNALAAALAALRQ